MADKTRDEGLRDGAEEQAAGHRDGMRVLSYLLAGPLLYGGGGWLIDHFVLDRMLLLPIGMVVGLALSIFMIIRRYGRIT